MIKYLIHKQGGYFNTIAKVIEELLDGEIIYTNNSNELSGIYVLFYTSFKSGFYKNIKLPYIVIQTEPDWKFQKLPDWKTLCDKALKVYDYKKNLNFRYSDVYRLECENSKDIDVLFYGLMSHRRAKILDNINVKNKIILSGNPTISGPELWKYINRSKIILSISHADDRIEGDWVRIAPLLSNKCFVIAEKVKDEKFNSLKDHIVISDYNELNKKIDFFINNPLERIKWADKGFDFIRKNKTSIV